MKISRRSVLRYSGLTAALLALTGCSASPGSAILGGDLPDWMKSLFCGSAASSLLLLLRTQLVRQPPPRQRPAKPQALRSAFCLPTTLTL